MRHQFFQTLRLSIPLIIANVAQISLGLLDSAMVGPISYKQLAASSVAINVLGLPQVICMGLAVAISPLVAIAKGKNDIIGAGNYLFNGVILATVFTSLVALICNITTPLLSHLGQDAEVISITQPYFSIMSWSLVPMMLFLSCKQFSDALGLTQTGMVLALCTLPINAFLNWLLIYGNWGFPRLELYGAGLATFITRLLVALVMVLVIIQHSEYKQYIKNRLQPWIIQWHTLKELLHIGIPSGLQYAMEAGAFALSGIMVGWLGATAQAAHQIALNIASFTFMIAVGISLGGSIRVSHAFGRKDGSLLRTIGISTLIGGLAYGLCSLLALIVLRYQLPLLFTNEPAVISAAAILLLLAGFFQISDSTQTICVGLLRGSKDVKTPTVLVAIAYWGIGIPVGYVLAFPLKMGAAGIWLGLVLGLSASAFLLSRRFLKKSAMLAKSMAAENRRTSLL